MKSCWLVAVVGLVACFTDPPSQGPDDSTEGSSPSTTSTATSDAESGSSMGVTTFADTTRGLTTSTSSTSTSNSSSTASDTSSGGTTGGPGRFCRSVSGTALACADFESDTFGWDFSPNGYELAWVDGGRTGSGQAARLAFTGDNPQALDYFSGRHDVAEVSALTSIDLVVDIRLPEQNVYDGLCRGQPFFRAAEISYTISDDVFNILVTVGDERIRGFFFTPIDQDDVLLFDVTNVGPTLGAWHTIDLRLALGETPSLLVELNGEPIGVAEPTGFQPPGGVVNVNVGPWHPEDDMVGIGCYSDFDNIVLFDNPA